MLKNPSIEETVPVEGQKMSTRIESVVYRASWRDEISANF
jgi:hypothetical protein